MKEIPLYREIAFDKADEESVIKKLSTTPLSRVPIYIVFKKQVRNHQALIDIIENYFKQHKINSRFPYPTYIISKQKVLSDIISIFNDEDDLPVYFNVREKNLNPLENEVYSKVVLLAEKLRNTPVKAKLKNIDQIREKTRVLFQLTREAQFYENILAKTEGEQ